MVILEVQCYKYLETSINTEVQLMWFILITSPILDFFNWKSPENPHFFSEISSSYPRRPPKFTNMDGGYLCVAKQCSQNSGEKSYIKLIKAPKIDFKLYRQTFNLRWLKVAWGLVWNSIYWVCYIFRILWSCKNFWELMFFIYFWLFQNSYEWLVTLTFTRELAAL